MKKCLLIRVVSLVACALGAGVIGCMASGDFSSLGGAGEFGATPGGIQDMQFARELVAQGRVPPPEAFVVEGMFSEHDLPLTGERCDTTLCMRTATGFAPDEVGVQSTWLQVGFSSTIDPEEHERPSLTVVGCVDTSGSMSGTPLTVSRAMLNALIDELGPDDRFGLVEYESVVRTLVPIEHVVDRARLHDEVNALHSKGSTAMEAGLERSFSLALHDEGETDQRRVWLFTDVQPNVGATSGTDFERMAATAADEGVGLTVFGVGLGLGQEVLVAMSHLRGGNAFSLFDEVDVEELMEESWPWMVSPIAYDLNVAIEPTQGLMLAESYGIPAEDGESASLDVSTIFLSRNRGAILLKFLPWSREALDDDHGIDVSLSYTTPDGERIEQLVTPTVPNVGDGDFFSQATVHKTVALAVLVRGMFEAATLYGTDRAAAVASMELVVERFDADVDTLGDVTLEAELIFAEQLLDLMRLGAEQGDLYSPSGY